MEGLCVDEAPALCGADALSGVGTVTGYAHVEGPFERMEITTRLDGGIYGHEIRDLAAEMIYGNDRLRVERLSTTVNGSALDLSGEYRLSDPPVYRGVVAFSDLDLSRFISDRDITHGSDLSGSIRFSGTGVDAERFRLQTWSDIKAGRYRDWAFDGVGGRTTVTADSVVLDSVRAELRGTLTDVSGPIRYDGDMELEISMICSDLAGIRSYHGIDDLTGALVAHATLETRGDTLDFFLMSTGNGVEYKKARFGSLMVELDLERFGGVNYGTTEIFASELDIRGFRAAEMIGDIAIEDNRLQLKRVVLERENNSLLGLTGLVDLTDTGFDLAVANLFVEGAGLIWENRSEISATYSNDSLMVRDFEVHSDMGRVLLSDASYANGVFALDLGIEDFDLGMLGEVLDREIPSGLLDARLAASGSADSLAFVMGFGVDRGEIRSVVFNDLGGRLVYDGRHLSIERMSLRQNGGSVEIKGLLPIDLAPRRVQELARSGSAYDLVDSLGNMEMEARGMDVSVLQPLIPPFRKLKGIVDFSMRVSGSKLNPKILTAGSMSDAFYGETSIGEIAWDLAMEDSVLRVADLSFGVGSERGEIRGEIPLALGILPFSGRLLDREIDLAVSVTGGDMELVCEIFPKLRVCTGTYDVDMSITGTVKDPRFVGELALSRTRLRYQGVAQDVRQLSLKLVADGKRFDLVSLVAEDDALRASGFFVMDGTSVSDWDFSIRLEDYMITEFEEVYARLEGDLSVTADRSQAGRVVPRITGDVLVKEGEFYLTTGRAAGGGGAFAPTATPGWLMDISVEIPNAFWIRSDEIEAELQGDLDIRRDRDGLVALGTLRTLRGTFYFFHNALKISRGEVRLADVNRLGGKVYIDVEAWTTVMDERITINATGYLDELEPQATSESGWDDRQILQALLLRTDPTADASSQGRISQEFLTAWGVALVNRFGSDAVRDLGLDRFGIKVDDAIEGGALAATRVYAGKYFSDKFYLEYEQSLGTLYGDRSRFTQRGLPLPDRQLSIEYRLSDRFAFEGETGTASGLQYFEFDLRYRFGY
jgi:hypothetical protein